MVTPMNRIFILLCLVWSLPLYLSAKTGRYRATWRSDPATTMVLGWEQRSGQDPRVYYTAQEGEGARWLIHRPDRRVQVREMDTYFARLAHLQPDTRYRFFIRDSEGDSPQMAFHTAPAEDKSTMTFLCGGDSRNNRSVRQRINQLAGALQPLAIFFSGDMTDWATVREWQEWLDDWQRTLTVDGRLIPIVVARGNHEPTNDLLVDLFDVPHPEVYYALGFGGQLLRLYTLNSMMPASGAQADWLQQDLETQGSRYQWRMAQYHLPIRPHQRRKRDQQAQYRSWAGLFYTHRVQLVQESDAHVAKITWPLRPDTGPGSAEGFIRDDERGTIYLGEGGWGAPLRAADHTKPWTRASGSFYQFNWVAVSRDRMEVRVIRTEESAGARPLLRLSRGELPEGLAYWRMGQEQQLVLRPDPMDEKYARAQQFPLVDLGQRRSLQIPYRLSAPAQVEIRFINLRRQVIHREVADRGAGYFTEEVEVGTLPAGQYLLEVLANGHSIMQRLIHK